MKKIIKYNLSQAARMIGIEKMGRTKIFKVLRELRIVDKNNKPMQEYIDENYLNFRLSPAKGLGPMFHSYVTLVVGERGLDFLKKTIEDYLKEHPQPTISRRRKFWSGIEI